MAIPPIFKVSRKTFVDPAGWLNYSVLKNQHKTLWDILKGLVKPPTPQRKETFLQAMVRLKLTETDVSAMQSRYRWYSFFFLALGLLVFIHAFYLLFTHGTLTGWLLGMATCALFLSQAYRYHFWSFQMKSRKLGATFAEWKRNILGQKGSTS